MKFVLIPILALCTVGLMAESVKAQAPMAQLSALQCAAVYDIISQAPVSALSQTATEARLIIIGNYAQDNGLLPDMVTDDVRGAAQGLDAVLKTRALSVEAAAGVCDKQFSFQVSSQSSVGLNIKSQNIPLAAENLTARKAKWATEPQTGFIHASCDTNGVNIRLTRSMTRQDVEALALDAGCTGIGVSTIISTYEDSKNQLDRAFAY